MSILMALAWVGGVVGALLLGFGAALLWVRQKEGLR